MTLPAHSDHPAAPTQRRAAGRRPGVDDGGYTAEVALQVGEAARVLGERLGDPAMPHSVADLELATRGFAATAEGMAAGVAGVTEWLRATGHAGALSGHASVVAERLVHVSRELTRLADAVDAAERSA
ncbi:MULTISPECIES: hypothetical protein [unclassified Saccharopolyspora]|uniref:hypothetical protein n=1 Tax=unclassified Saccharopolyspora TaxID=2646250 RepID=UPI001CD48287|nr:MULTISPECIES: hypothetical protein [unclassified Saccharopolyspora]MCA1195665.1 hypothetical protein [Saccharopolyspora sp. 6V]MCA1229066.1 hypothetical protein [Saccharopolyspora sp. 6M]MCA1282993.1 hypothetical protein [Saccharopolyspora sp. 7B]